MVGPAHCSVCIAVIAPLSEAVTINLMSTCPSASLHRLLAHGPLEGSSSIKQPTSAYCCIPVQTMYSEATLSLAPDGACKLGRLWSLQRLTLCLATQAAAQAPDGQQKLRPAWCVKPDLVYVV